jgi:hypothetical protein
VPKPKIEDYDKAVRQLVYESRGVVSKRNALKIDAKLLLYYSHQTDLNPRMKWQWRKKKDWKNLNRSDWHECMENMMGSNQFRNIEVPMTWMMGWFPIKLNRLKFSSFTKSTLC